MPFDRTVFPVNRYARKIADVLVGAGQLIKECCFSTVLVSDQSISQYRAVRKRMLTAFFMIFAALAKPRMFPLEMFLFRKWMFSFLRNFFNLDLLGICKTQCQFIAMDFQLHRITHRSHFLDRDLCTGDHAHIKKVLTKSTFAAKLCDNSTFAYL